METKTIQIGDEIEISLKGKGTSGFTWKYTLIPSNIISLEEKKQVNKDAGSLAPGVSLPEVFTIKGIQQGTATIHFYLTRSWEKKTALPIEEKDIMITVE
ncbi:MAG: protease inhibitor I42 family protein [Ferruginibacter sp.]